MAMCDSFTPYQIKDRLTKLQKQEAKPKQTQNEPNTFSSTYYHHRKLHSWELWMDDIRFKAREMRQPLSTWKFRHFCGLYILSRFVMRPVLYFPGIISFYCIQPGRRFNRIWRSVPFKLPKLMAEPFWISGGLSPIYFLEISIVYSMYIHCVLQGQNRDLCVSHLVDNDGRKHVEIGQFS